MVNKHTKYVAHNGELEGVKLAVKASMNVLLVGATGTGKTVLAETACDEVQKGITTIQGSSGVTYEQMVGYRTLENGVIKWVDGLITAAMRKGEVLYVDEPNAMPDDIRFVLFSAMDHRRTIVLPENGGEVVTAAPGFTVIGSMNEGAGYGGTTALNRAFRDRFHATWKITYLPEKDEVKLLMGVTGVSKSLAERACKVAQSLRNSLEQHEIRTPVSTRSLIAWMQLCQAGLSEKEAAKVTIMGRIPSTDEAERRVFETVLIGQGFQ